MTTETGTFRSRRALLGAALGGAAAVAAQASAPLVALGADNEAALLGVANTSTLPTSFENATADAVSLHGKHAGAGTGVQGTSANGPGVGGGSGDLTNATAALTEAGVYGYCDTTYGSMGVYGETYQGVGVMGAGDWGVYGLAGSAGVVGDAPPEGIGVMGYTGTFDTWPATLPTGIGVYALAPSTTQTALLVQGKARFSRSGRKSIGATKTSLKVTMGGVSTSSYVLATLQTSVSGCYVRAVVPASGSFTIYLSKAPGKTVYVGYMVIN